MALIFPEQHQKASFEGLFSALLCKAQETTGYIWAKNWNDHTTTTVAKEKHQPVTPYTSKLAPTSAICKQIQVKQTVFAGQDVCISLGLYSHCKVFCGAVSPSWLPGKLAEMVKLTNRGCTIRINLHRDSKTMNRTRSRYTRKYCVGNLALYSSPGTPLAALNTLVSLIRSALLATAESFGAHLSPHL